MRLAPEGSSLAPPRARPWRWGGLALVAAVALGAHALHAGAVVPRLLEWARGTGWIGLVVLGLLYVPAVLAMIPAAVITMAAGLVFGPVPAFLVALPAGTLSACVAFQAGRLMAGDPARRFRGDDRLARLARSLGTRRGFWTVLVLRLSPVTPFAVLNYALGATPLRLSTFALATLLGAIPSTLLYANATSLLDALLRWAR